MRLERVLRLGVVCCHAVALFAAGCGDQHSVAETVDAGAEDGGVSSEPDEDAAATVVLAPSGAVVEPAVTLMSSGHFQLVGSMSVGSGVTSASERYELRSASYEVLR